MRIRVLLLTAATLVGLAVPAEATARGFPDLLRPAAANQFPEGVAWDASREALLVGSIFPARISAVGRDGVARTIVSEPEAPAILGLKVDAARERIVAVIGSTFPELPSGLAVYDLETGARQSMIDLPGSPNDVALDPRGTAYVSDTAGAIYRVGLDGQVSTLVSDARLGPAPGANGMAWHPRGYLLVVNYTTGKLFRVSPAGRLSEVRLPEPLVGADGIALRPNGTLVVVTNTLLPLPGSRVAVHELVLGNGFAVPYRVTEWPDPAPTTVAHTPYGDYVIDGHFDVLLAGGTTSTDFVLRKL